MTIKAILEPDMQGMKFQVSLENERGERLVVLSGAGPAALKKKAELERFLAPYAPINVEKTLPMFSMTAETAASGAQ